MGGLGAPMEMCLAFESLPPSVPARLPYKMHGCPETCLGRRCGCLRACARGKEQQKGARRMGGRAMDLCLAFEFFSLSVLE